MIPHARHAQKKGICTSTPRVHRMKKRSSGQPMHAPHNKPCRRHRARISIPSRHRKDNARIPTAALLLEGDPADAAAPPSGESKRRGRRTGRARTPPPSAGNPLTEQPAG